MESRKRWIIGLALGTALLQPLPAAAASDDEQPVRGEVLARLSVTVKPDDQGTLTIPSPFVVLPDLQRVAIYVPESSGIFLLQGDRVLHHFPLPTGVTQVHDLGANERFLVAGRRAEGGHFACTLFVFDLETGEEHERVQSTDTMLRCAGPGADLWRVVVDEDLVGIYHPEAGASVPLWSRERGFLERAQRRAGQRAGLGFGGSQAWVPRADGSVGRSERGTTRSISGPLGGYFLGGLENGDLLLMEPTDIADVPGEGGILLPTELLARRWHQEIAITEIRLKAIGTNVDAEKIVMQGRPIQVLGDRIFWVFMGHDFLEIRSTQISPLPPSLVPHESGRE